jgi:hypothetical protein
MLKKPQTRGGGGGWGSIGLLGVNIDVSREEEKYNFLPEGEGGGIIIQKYRPLPGLEGPPLAVPSCPSGYYTIRGCGG